MTENNATPPPPQDPQQPQQPQQQQGQPNQQAPQGQYQQPQYAAPQPMTAADEKTQLLISHIGMILTGFLVPLIIWLISKDRSARINDEGKAILNFGILYSIVMFVGAILWIILIGGLIQLAMFVFAVIFGIQGAMAVNRGESYKYPFNFSFVK